MRRWILLAALALVALAAFAPHTLWAEGAGVRATVPSRRIYPSPTKIVIPEPNGQLTFRVFTDRAPYTGTVVTVPLSLSNDQCSLSATEAVITESNWDTGFAVTVTANANWLLPTTVVDLDAAVAADSYYDGWDSLENVVVTVMDRRIVQPFIARSWDNTYWETESNNTMEQADGPIPHGTYVRGRLPWGDERDYYRFEVITPKTIVAILSEIPSGRNYDLILRDSEGNTRVEEGWYVPKSGNADERIETTEAISPGVYYLDVYYRSGGGSSSPYLLRVWYK